MDTTPTQAAFVAAGLTRVVKDLNYLARSSIRLNTTPIAETAIPIGTSKLGGTPDLPTGTDWPEWQKLPQSFIAQIRLADVRPYDTNRLLPQQGILWFFYDAQQQTYGADPADRGGWLVLYTASDTPALQRTPFPASLPVESRFTAASPSFSNEITLSQQPQMDIPHYDWTAAEQQQYENLLAAYPNSTDHAAIHHRLLGNPDTIQDDMREQCQLVSHGITDSSDPKAAALLNSAKDWQLLLQIDSDEHLGMRWANTGMLYYWIPATNLQAQHFNTTWLVLQSE